MDAINKFYTSVSQTVSTLSSVFSGNPLTKEYDIAEHIGSAGSELVWKIYTGSKRSTKEAASIFAFDKKQLELFTKDEREEICENIRRGVVQLTKIRHPQVLTVQHAMEESRDTIAFATEPVVASVANLLGNTANVSNSGLLAEYKLSEFDIKYGVFELIKGIQFLHDEAQLIHRNICTENIVVNRQGVWKLFGFGFCWSKRTPGAPVMNHYFKNRLLGNPGSKWTAPELILENSCNESTDIYSLGILIYTIYSRENIPSPDASMDLYGYKQSVTKLSNQGPSKLNAVPEVLRGEVKRMLSVNPQSRPTLQSLVQISYFCDNYVQCLDNLETLFPKDNLEKSEFYKRLSQIIGEFPHRVRLYRILPSLVKEFVNCSMIPFVLTNILTITASCTQAEYMQHISSHLRPVMLLDEPVQIMLIFFQNLDVLLKVCPSEEVRASVLPLVYKALESKSQQIQELCLSIIPSLVVHLEKPTIKAGLVPRIKTLCSGTNLVSVRVKCLLCLGQLATKIDKWVMIDDIVAFLPSVNCREPAVIMAIVGVYKISFATEGLGIPKDVLACKVLPHLFPMTIVNGLSLQQFNAIISLIKEFTRKIEDEQGDKLGSKTPISASASNGSLQEKQKSALQNDLQQSFGSLGMDAYGDFMQSTTTPQQTQRTLTSPMQLAKPQQPIQHSSTLNWTVPPVTTTAKENSNKFNLFAQQQQQNVSPLSTSSSSTSSSSSSAMKLRKTDTPLALLPPPAPAIAVPMATGPTVPSAWLSNLNGPTMLSNVTAPKKLESSTIPNPYGQLQPLIPTPTQKTRDTGKSSSSPMLSKEDIMEFLQK
ncbi:SCY1-like protein 2 [Anopheles ziemanni]|uniref:SCY1-like protein 2 n=1 Tax=Anopheles coustani TaxID=139045 RepID=UPI00265A5D45|nr:SCY1-like protein 2 [Anopheles coustani]XP_058171695.1 SCY1-like protein 2 [Anopheles ziemanni]